MEFEIKDIDRVLETMDKIHDTFNSIHNLIRGFHDTFSRDDILRVVKALETIANELVAENETL